MILVGQLHLRLVCQQYVWHREADNEPVSVCSTRPLRLVDALVGSVGFQTNQWK